MWLPRKLGYRFLIHSSSLRSAASPVGFTGGRIQLTYHCGTHENDGLVHTVSRVTPDIWDAINQAQWSLRWQTLSSVRSAYTSHCHSPSLWPALDRWLYWEWCAITSMKCYLCRARVDYWMSSTYSSNQWRKPFPRLFSPASAEAARLEK